MSDTNQKPPTISSTLTKACLNCQRIKSRCIRDGSSGSCHHCNVRNIPCIFSDRKKRGPQRGYYDMLTNRLERVTKTLESTRHKDSSFPQIADNNFVLYTTTSCSATSFGLCQAKNPGLLIDGHELEKNIFIGFIAPPVEDKTFPISEDVQKRLFKYYTDKMHGYFPVLDLYSFFKSLEPETKSPPSSHLILTVCAAAASQAPSLLSSEISYHCLKNLVYNQIIHLSTPCISSVQSLCIFLVHCKMERRSEMAVVAGRLTTAAQTLGLSVMPQFFPPNEAGYAKRLWWCVVISELWYSTSIDALSPLLSLDTESFLPGPSTHQDHTYTEGTTLSSIFFRHLCLLTKILINIQKSTTSMNQIDLSENIDRLERLLDIWYSNLPNRISLEANNLESKILIGAGHLVRLLLYHPFISFSNLHPAIERSLCGVILSIREIEKEEYQFDTARNIIVVECLRNIGMKILDDFMETSTARGLNYNRKWRSGHEYRYDTEELGLGRNGR